MPVHTIPPPVTPLVFSHQVPNPPAVPSITSADIDRARGVCFSAAPSANTPTR